MEKVVDATVARRQLGTLLDEVYYKGESIIIERKGKALAKIVPLTAVEKKDEKSLTAEQRQLLAELNDQLNSLPAFEIEEEPTDVLRKIRRMKAEKAGTRYGN